MNRGEIRWYKFKKPDKKRPVLILSRNSIIDHLNEVTIAPVTTTVRDIPSEVFLSKESGMPRDCSVNFDHIQTVAKKNIGSLITTLTGQDLIEVSKAISFALELG
jgi:mRNA interferase MazF